MPLEVAVIADDLSGALDTAGPFAARGLRVAVATAPQHVDAALAGDPEVVAVATATRHGDAATAAAVMEATAAALAPRRPRLAFKKVDSRLKGHVAAETAAMARIFGRGRVVVAPAIPDLGRLVSGGAVIGSGVAEPIAVAPLLAGLAAEVPETADDAALDAVAGEALRRAGETLLVGARGLGLALARRLGRGAPAAAFAAAAPVALVIGSRDPITLEQVARLSAALPEIAVETAPDGRLPPQPAQRSGSRLFLATEGGGAEAGEVVAARFAAGAAARLAAAPAATIVASGGDTAIALVEALGVGVLVPRGEARPGMPWCEIADAAGRRAVLVTKSGGFGAPEALLDLLAGQPAAA